ncbi:MAG: DMT family transporter [Anaerolineae bacterium]|jgi:drug/metabolite transporter (DMT)-like permease
MSLRGSMNLRPYRGEIWALISAIAYALSTLFLRIAVRDYDLNYLMGVTLRALPTFLFALGAGVRISRSGSDYVSPFVHWALVAMLAGYGVLTFIVGNPLHLAALRAGGVLVATPITGTQALWAAVIAAVFLRQRLSWKMVGGTVVLVAGIALLAVGQSGGEPATDEWWRAVPLATGTALCWSLSGVLITGAMERGVNRFHALAVATGFGIGLLTLYLALSGQIDVYVDTPLTIHAALLTAGLLNAVALVSITTALSLTTVASAVTLNSLQIALAPLFAWVLLAERPNLLMLFGIVTVSGGAMLVQRARLREGT